MMQKFQWGEELDPQNWSENPLSIQGFLPEADKIYQLKVKKIAPDSPTPSFSLVSIKKEETHVPEGKRNLHLLKQLYDNQIVFYARGQEPGWGIDLYDQGKIELHAQGESKKTIKNSSATLQFQEEARRVQIVNLPADAQIAIAPEKCQDPMSGEPYNYSVVFTPGDKTLYGCGTRVPNPALDGTYEWSMAKDAEGNPLPWSFAEKPYLRFDLHQYQIIGSGGCNKIQAALDAGRADLFIHFLLSTRKYCEGVDESLLTGALNNTLFEYSFANQNQTLILQTSEGIQLHWNRRP
jgi:uncharacterized membrane protein/heat shock protein HslJ